MMKMMKFNLVDSRHNFFHQLIVFLIKVAISLVLIPFSLYTLAIGFWFAKATIGPFLPKLWIEKMIFYSHQLPYTLSLEDNIFRFLGSWYLEAKTWW